MHKPNTPKRCLKECIERVSLSRGMHTVDSSKDAGTPSRFTRSRVKHDNDSPRYSSVKQTKRGARTGTHNDTPSRQTRNNPNLDEEQVESLRKKSRYMLNMEADSINDSPLKLTDCNTDGDADGTPSRQTRGHSKMTGKVNILSPKEGKINDSVVVEVSKPKFIAGSQWKNTKSNLNCEEKSKCDFQRHGRVKANTKEVLNSECPSRNTRSNSRCLEKAGSPQKYKDKCSDRKKKMYSILHSNNIVGGLEETIVTPSRQTRRCIIFSDSNELNVKQINKLADSSASSNTSCHSTNISRPTVDKSTCESTEANRQPKHVLSKTSVHNSDASTSGFFSSINLTNLTKQSLIKKVSSVIKEASTIQNQRDISSDSMPNKEEFDSDKSIDSLHNQSVRMPTSRTRLSHKFSDRDAKYLKNKSPTQNRSAPDEVPVVETTDISVQTVQAVTGADLGKPGTHTPLRNSSSSGSLGLSSNDFPIKSEVLLQEKAACLLETKYVVSDTASSKTDMRSLCVGRVDHKTDTPDVHTHTEMRTTVTQNNEPSTATQELNNADGSERSITIAEMKDVSFNRNNLSSVQDAITTPKCVITHEQLQVGSNINMKYQSVCEASTSTKLNLKTFFATASLTSCSTQDASEDVNCKDSKDSIVTCSVDTDISDSCMWYTEADDKGRLLQGGRRSVTPMPCTSSSEILLYPQDSLSSVWARELLDELVDISSSGSDGSEISGDMGYNLEDFVLRRRRLRSESQDSELWEGLPTSVRYRKSGSKMRHFKCRDAGNDTDSVDDMMLCQDSNYMLINSDDTDSIMSDTVHRYQENCTETEIDCNAEENNTLFAKTELNIRRSCDIYNNDGDHKTNTFLMLPLKSSIPSRDDVEICDDLTVLNRASCTHWTPNRTLLPEMMKTIQGSPNSYSTDHSSISADSRSDSKVLLDIASPMKAETRSTAHILEKPQILVRDDILKNIFSSTISSNSNNTAGTISNPYSIQEDNVLQETDVSSTLSSYENEIKPEGKSNLDKEMTMSQVNSVRTTQSEDSSYGVKSADDKTFIPLKETAINESVDSGSASTDDNASSHTNALSNTITKESKNQTDVSCAIGNNNIPSSKKETFLSPLDKRDCVAFQTRRSTMECKDNKSSDRAEPKGLSINALQTRILKNTPRPTSSSSTPWMYNKQRMKNDSLASPFLSCRSTRKSAETNASCSSSHVNDSSGNHSDQNTSTSVSLSMTNSCVSSRHGNEQTEDGDKTKLKSQTNTAITDINNDKSFRVAVKQRGNDVLKLDVSTENQTSSTISNEVIMNDAKLNYHKSKFPKVVLTPLKRSQRLIKKYGIDCPVKDVKIKQKRKKHETITSSEDKNDETPGSSKDSNEASLDTVLSPAGKFANSNQGCKNPERKLAVRKHRRKQDLLEYQLTDDDTNEGRSLAKVRKKSHVSGNSSAPLHRSHTEKEEEKNKVTEKRKNKKGKNKPKTSSTVSTSSNIFGLRRKRGPVVDEELLANPLYNKHACVLWSSEHRRHYHLIHPDADYNQLDNILRKHWEELLPTEKMRYFYRARDAVLDEFKHSKKSSTVLKQKSRSKESNQNITPMEKFCQLNAKRQKELLSKWLYFYQKVLSCRDYKWFISDVQRTLKNIQSSQKGEHKPLTSSKLEHRKLLFEKINKVKPKVISQYMDRCKKNTKTNDQNQRSVIQNLIKGLPQNFPKGYRSRCLTRVLEDLRELESKSLLHVVGIPKATPSYTKLYKGIAEISGTCVQTASISTACFDGSLNKDRTNHFQEKVMVDDTREVSMIEKPLMDISNNEYVNKLISDLRMVKELPVLEASDIESALIDVQASKVEQTRTTSAQSKTIGCSLVTALHKEAVDALVRSQSGNGETCCELDSPSCILSTWLVADRVVIGTEPILKK